MNVFIITFVFKQTGESHTSIINIDGLKQHLKQASEQSHSALLKATLVKAFNNDTISDDACVDCHEKEFNACDQFEIKMLPAHVTVRAKLKLHVQ